MKFQQSEIKISARVFVEYPDPNEIHDMIGLSVDLNGNKSGNVGVYEIVSKMNGRRYIGKARDLFKRMNRHSLDLMRGIHHSKSLQDDYNKFTVGGIEESVNEVSPWKLFDFRVIVYCRESELTFWENVLIKYINPYYNIHKQREIVCEEE